MATLATDTSPHAEQVQLELLRRASPAQRFHLVNSLTETTLRMTQRTLKRLNPQASPEELQLRFLAVVYGDRLAAQVRADLRARRES